MQARLILLPVIIKCTALSILWLKANVGLHARHNPTDMRCNAHRLAIAAKHSQSGFMQRSTGAFTGLLASTLGSFLT